MLIELNFHEKFFTFYLIYLVMIRIASIQIAPIFLDAQKTWKKLVSKIVEAKSNDVDFQILGHISHNVRLAYRLAQTYRKGMVVIGPPQISGQHKGVSRYCTHRY